MVFGLHLPAQSLPLEGMPAKSLPLDSETLQPLSFAEHLKMQEKQLQQEQGVGAASVAAALAAWQTLPIPVVAEGETGGGADVLSVQPETTRTAIPAIGQAQQTMTVESDPIGMQVDSSTPLDGFPQPAVTAPPASRLVSTDLPAPASEIFSNAQAGTAPPLTGIPSHSAPWPQDIPSNPKAKSGNIQPQAEPLARLDGTLNSSAAGIAIPAMKPADETAAVAFPAQSMPGREDESTPPQIDLPDAPPVVHHRASQPVAPQPAAGLSNSPQTDTDERRFFDKASANAMANPFYLRSSVVKTGFHALSETVPVEVEERTPVTVDVDPSQLPMQKMESQDASPTANPAHAGTEKVIAGTPSAPPAIVPADAENETVKVVPQPVDESETSRAKPARLADASLPTRPAVDSKVNPGTGSGNTQAETPIASAETTMVMPPQTEARSDAEVQAGVAVIPAETSGTDEVSAGRFTSTDEKSRRADWRLDAVQPRLNQMHGVAAAAASPGKEAVVESSGRMPGIQVNIPAVEVVQQIIRQMNGRLKSGPASMRLQLHPKELGAIDVEMVGRPQGVQVTFFVEQAETGKLLESGMKQLRDSLVDSGVQLSGLNISQHSSYGQKGGTFSQETEFVPRPPREFMPDEPGQEPPRAGQLAGQTGEVDYRI
ncbi:MAG: hypothetical protein HND47_07295 [Chloroflexi bacterium]|nr:hypothetical protein [Chloroflexota bacterium]